MTTSFSIQSTPPLEITQSSTQPEATALSADELRICFPCDVAMATNGCECVVLHDAPVLGVLVDLSESCTQLERGAPFVEVVDFYGEYKLILRKPDDHITCEDEFTGSKCRALAGLFVAGVREWSQQVFATIEGHHPAILSNQNYTRLRTRISSTLAALS